MEPQQVVAYLKRMPLFVNLDDERGEMELYQIAKIVEEKTFNEGEWLFSQGQNSDRLYYILEGRVQLTRIDPNGVKHDLGIREAGGIFGETGLVIGDFHDATAAALTVTRVLYILRSDFTVLLEKQAHLRRKLKVRAEVARRQKLPKFSWLRKDEWVIFSEQRHWARLFRKVGPPLLLFVLLLLVFGLVLSTNTTWGQIVAVGLGLFLIGLMLLAGWQYFNWRDDFFVLTTQRVVHIERVWPLRENFEESSLANLENTYLVRSGLMANLLNYGSLVLQTAGETVEIDMDFIGHPAYLSELVSREIERARERDVLRSIGAIREELAKRLDVKTVTAPEPVPVRVEPPRPTMGAVIFGSIRDYFFPPPWSVSPDGGTVIWRRFWLPGYVHYLRIFIPLLVTTLGGAYLLLRNWYLPYMIWLMVAWLVVEVFLFAILLWYIEDWRNDYFQLTANRLVLVERKPLLLRESRREAPLDRIQNISFTVPGVFGRMFHYGHVMMETAGTTGKFELKWLRDPQRVQSEISQRQRQYIQRQKQADAQRRREEFLSWFATYDSLRGGGAPKS
ncbi:MAG TPA: cyclic nucleotide-binding domain-containing protein [Anaerolineae bacterium]|nr:cyclic nucleotide-binding domain-containing protein [Anaerolineae bacterium]